MNVRELTIDLIETSFSRHLSSRNEYSNLFYQLIYRLVHSPVFSNSKIDLFITHFGRIFYKDVDIWARLLESYDGLSVDEMDSQAINHNADIFHSEYVQSKGNLFKLLKSVELNEALLYIDMFELASEDLIDPYYPLDHSFKKLSEGIANYEHTDHVILINAMDIESIQQAVSVIVKNLYVLMRKIQLSELLVAELNEPVGRTEMLYRIEGPSEALKRELFKNPIFTDSNIDYCIKHIESVYVLPNGNRMKPESIRRVINRYKKNESRKR